ncbi:hypothetical protein C8J57DRAFT_1514526 [Mycena rebaudengoi]|nr:hypothetical protein C8J57DRAFT_1514526 [Mycena rebaudengoi]
MFRPSSWRPRGSRPPPTPPLAPPPSLRSRCRAKKSVFGRRLLPFARSRRDPVLPRHYRAAFTGRGGARVDTDDDATALFAVADTSHSISSIPSSSSELVDLGTSHSNPLCPRSPSTPNPSRALCPALGTHTRHEMPVQAMGFPPPTKHFLFC